MVVICGKCGGRFVTAAGYLGHACAQEKDAARAAVVDASQLAAQAAK
jgi:hypothetical protein